MISDNIFMLEFAEQKQPEFIAQKGKEWVLYGKDNDYTKYLIDLYNRHAEHNAIVSAKSAYIAGKGLSYDKTKVTEPDEQAKLEKFINRANQFETWDKVIEKITTDFELFNGYALQVIYGAGGKVTDVYHLEFSKLRLSKCGKKAYYCNNWYQTKPENDSSFAYYPLYTNEIKSGTAILYYKIHRPTALEYGSVYPIPDYVGATSAIETDVNIDVFHLSNTQNGMTAQGLLTFFNGNPTEEDKRKIKRMFERNYTGPNKAGSTIMNFVDENQKGAEFTTLTQSDLDKQFEILSKRLQQKIFTGHKVTNPILFGIKTEGQLGNRNELLESFEHFTKTYIDLRKPHILYAPQLFAKKADLQYTELFIEPLEPIGLELPLNEAQVSEALTFDEKRQLIAQKYNIELQAVSDENTKKIPLASRLGVGGTTSLLQVIQSAIPAQQKVSILIGVFGLPPKKAYDIIGFTPQTATPVIQAQSMSEEKDGILEALLACGQDSNDDEILEEKFIEFDSEEACLKFEKEQAYKFADVLTGDVRTTRNSILELLSGNPETKPELIAKQLGLDVEYVNEQINLLIDNGIINETVAGFFPTGKGLDKLEGIEPIVETEIYTVYKYAVRDDVAPAKTGSRPFCTKLMASSKEWTKEQILDLSNQFGTNVWIYRGGYYNNPKTKEIEPYCRHVWKAITKVKRKK